jgi:hypothetical protein
MSRRFQFSLRGMTRVRLGEALLWAALAVFVLGALTSVAIDLWVESMLSGRMSYGRWINIYWTYGMISMASLWGGVALAKVLLCLGLWLRRNS